MHEFRDHKGFRSELILSYKDRVAKYNFGSQTIMSLRSLNCIVYNGDLPFLDKSFKK